MDIIKYLRTYYPEITINNDFIFQERVRNLSADINNYNRVCDGTYTFKKLIDTYIFDDYNYLSEEFKDFFFNKIPLYNPNKNNREIVKEILMWPTGKYPKWMEDKCDMAPEIATDIIRDFKPMMGIVDGKIYCCIEKGFLDEVCSAVDMCIDGIALQKNTEGPHITIVNSNILCKHNEEKIWEFLAKYEEPIMDLKFTIVKHTFSQDWPMFSICKVLEVESKTIDAFIADFNETFGEKIKPSLHITYAIKPRNEEDAKGLGYNVGSSTNLITE